MVGFSLLWCMVITIAATMQFIPWFAALVGALVYTLTFIMIGLLYIHLSTHDVKYADALKLQPSLRRIHGDSRMREGAE